MAFVPASFVGTVDDIWFTDKDDGTLIHIFDGGGLFSAEGRCPPPDFFFEQNVELNSCDELDTGPLEGEETECPGFGTVTKTTFVLDIDSTTPLPADHSFSGGSISRLDDRLVMYVEEFTPSRVGEDTALVGQQKFNPVKTFITRYDFVNTESLGTSDGGDSQSFTVSGSEILLPTKGTSIIFVGGIDGERWSVIDSLLDAEATSKVFEYNATTGTVTFGDGTKGAVPESGQEIVLRITIRNGGGQWTFISIVESPKDTKNIGGVKSIGDKTFYVQTGIAMADAAKMTDVVTEINFAEQSTYFGEAIPSKLKRITRRYDLAFGGEMNATGGTILLAFTSGVGYIEVLSPNTSPSIVRLEVDDSIVYPSFRATTPVPGVGPTDLDPPTPTYDPQEVRGGVHTSPKLYEDSVRIEPIFLIRETQNFRTQVGSNLLDDPYYVLEFFVGESSGTPITNDRDKRLIKIGDSTPPTGMTRITPIIDPSEEWTGGTGTFEDPVQTGTFGDLSGPSSVNGLTNQVIISNGDYSQRLIGSSDRHLEWVTIELENRQDTRDAALATHIFASVLPAFVCKWTLVEGSVTILPNIL